MTYWVSAGGGDTVVNMAGIGLAQAPVAVSCPLPVAWNVAAIRTAVPDVGSVLVWVPLAWSQALTVLAQDPVTRQVLVDAVSSARGRTAQVGLFTVTLCRDRSLADVDARGQAQVLVKLVAAVRDAVDDVDDRTLRAALERLQLAQFPAWPTVLTG